MQPTMTNEQDLGLDADVSNLIETIERSVDYKTKERKEETKEMMKLMVEQNNKLLANFIQELVILISRSSSVFSVQRDRITLPYPVARDQSIDDVHPQVS